MSASDQDDWISWIDTKEIPVLVDGFWLSLPAGEPSTPQDIAKYEAILGRIRPFIWKWFDANRERKLGTFKVIIFNFTLKVKHCEALIELILGERV